MTALSFIRMRSCSIRWKQAIWSMMRYPKRSRSHRRFTELRRWTQMRWSLVIWAEIISRRTKGTHGEHCRSITLHPMWIPRQENTLINRLSQSLRLTRKSRRRRSLSLTRPMMVMPVSHGKKCQGLTDTCYLPSTKTRRDSGRTQGFLRM